MKNKLSRVGVGVGLPEIKANSAQFQVKLPTGAELGNMIYKTIDIDLLQTKVMCHEEIVLVKNGKKGEKN